MDKRDVWREPSVEWCNEAMVVAGAEEESPEAGDVDAGGEVWVPTVRLKNAVVASSVLASDEVSPSSSMLPFDTPLGIVDTFCSSLSTRPVRLLCAVEKRSCRADVSDSSIGSTRYFDVP